MVSTVYSAGVIGVDGYLVEVECDTWNPTSRRSCYKESSADTARILG